MSLLTELRQCRICRVMLAYLSLILLLFQMVELFINNYDLDHRFLTACIVAAVVFFPQLSLGTGDTVRQVGNDLRPRNSVLTPYSALLPSECVDNLSTKFIATSIFAAVGKMAHRKASCRC